MNINNEGNCNKQCIGILFIQINNTNANNANPCESSKHHAQYHDQIQNNIKNVLFHIVVIYYKYKIEHFLKNSNII